MALSQAVYLNRNQENVFPSFIFSPPFLIIFLTQLIRYIMKLLIKSILSFALFLSFTFTAKAQCVETLPLQGQTTVCEEGFAAYYIIYATENNANVTLSVTGGTILRTANRIFNPKEALVAIMVKWDATPGNANGSGTVQVHKSATGCSSTASTNITILDSTTGGCN